MTELGGNMNEGIPWLWWFVRVSGLVAYGGLWLSMLFGVLVAGRGAGGVVHTPSVMELHRQWSLLALGATGVHALLSLRGPHGVPVTTLVPLLPAASATSAAMTLGALALWGLAALVASSLLRARLSVAAWRGLHAAAFAAWMFALAHAILAGTDAVSRGVHGVLLASAAVLGAAFVQRVIVTVIGGKPAAAAKGKAALRAGGGGQ